MTDDQIREGCPLGMRFKHAEWQRHTSDGIVPADCIVTRIRNGLIYYCRSASDGKAMLETEASCHWSDFKQRMKEPEPLAPARPAGRFAEVPYWSFTDWLGIVWRPGFVMDAPKGPRKPSQDAIKASTAWASIEDYTRATGRTDCPTGYAWLVPGPDHRLVMLTGIMSKPMLVGPRRKFRF